MKKILKRPGVLNMELDQCAHQEEHQDSDHIAVDGKSASISQVEEWVWKTSTQALQTWLESLQVTNGWQQEL